MTVIAWDGTTLAADKRVLGGYLISGATKKIFRIGDALVGISGPLAESMARVAWWRDGARPEAFPGTKAAPDDRVEMLVIRQGELPRLYGESPHPAPMTERCVALGSGEALALMAMRCGHDAAEAVRLTCELNASCGNGIDTLTFEDSE